MYGFIFVCVLWVHLGRSTGPDRLAPRGVSSARQRRAGSAAFRRLSLIGSAGAHHLLGDGTTRVALCHSGLSRVLMSSPLTQLSLRFWAFLTRVCRFLSHLLSCRYFSPVLPVAGHRAGPHRPSSSVGSRVCRVTSVSRSSVASAVSAHSLRLSSRWLLLIRMSPPVGDS